jgi:hypothetical protein
MVIVEAGGIELGRTRETGAALLKRGEVGSELLLAGASGSPRSGKEERELVYGAAA